MIKMSRQTDYALQLIFALSQAKNAKAVSLKVFSKESNISFLFLQKIARALRHEGIIVAERGSRGGYRLARSIANISLKSVVEAVDGPYGVSACTKPGSTCHKVGACNMQRGMELLKQTVVRELERLSVADMMHTV
jgi:Rrf2 family protein